MEEAVEEEAVTLHAADCAFMPEKRNLHAVVNLLKAPSSNFLKVINKIRYKAGRSHTFGKRRDFLRGFLLGLFCSSFYVRREAPSTSKGANFLGLLLGLAFSSIG